MLSPKATNVVSESFGGTVNVTLKEHVFVTLFESVAVHVTGVVPIGNTAPLAGAQTTCVGGVPPVDVAAGNDTGIGCPTVDCVVWLFGQVTCNVGGGGGGGGVGVVLDPEQAVAAHTATAGQTNRKEMKRRFTRGIAS